MAENIESLRLELDRARIAYNALRQRAADLLGNISSLQPALEQTAATWLDKAGLDIDQIGQRDGGPLWSNWQSSAWQHGQPGRATLDVVRIGRRHDPNPLPSERYRPDLAKLVPLFAGNGPVLVVCDDATRPAARTLLQSIVLRTALAVPAEIRFSLLDPIGLGASFPFRSGLPRVRPAGRTIADEVIEDIRRINERVIGHADRFAHLSADQRAGESFELIAAVDFPRAYMKDPRAVDSLVRIGNSGPRAGRHLLLEVNLDQPLPHDFQFDQFHDAVTVDLRQADFDVDQPPESAFARTMLDAASRAGQQQQSGEWATVVRPQTMLAQSASKRVETPIGERLRVWLGEDDDGFPSSHAIIAGQVGSGKSSLLHVLITGLATRYTADEMQLVLIDGKDGIELEIYRDLPQASIICLRTSPAMARSVLSDYVDEMKHRYELFQSANVVKLEDYRAKTGKPMPRRVLVVDEYQQLLDGDEERGGALLQMILEKGRAAGTHLVLASQTFNVRGMPPEAMSHIHTRVALALAPDYVQSIQAFGAEGKRLIRELAPSGQAVVNDRSGNDGASVRGAVARIARREGEDTVAAAITEVANATGTTGRAIVLNGREAALVTDNPFVRRWFGHPPAPLALQEIARQPTRVGGFGMEGWTAADSPLGLWLGRRFDVYGHALCALRRAPAQNLLILGPNVELRHRMLACALATLPSMISPGQLAITLIDGLRQEMPGGGMLRLACDLLRRAGASITVATDDDAPTAIAALHATLTDPAAGDHTRLLVIADPDYLYSLQGGADRFAAPVEGAPAELRAMLTRGPQQGLHTVVSASGLAAFGNMLSANREARFFNHRAVQQMNEDESMSLFASLLAARIAAQAGHPNAALLVDQIQGNRAATLLNAYAANPDLNAPQDRSALERRLAQLGAAEMSNVA